MEELKEEIPCFLSMGLKYVELAGKEKNLFQHSIATIVSTNITNIAPEEISRLLIEACAGFKLYHRENKGDSGNET